MMNWDKKNKIALLGAGKTGSKVAELVGADSVTIFNRGHSPTAQNLKNHQVIISFLPGEAFLNFIPMLLESGVPVVSGSTGFSWPSDLDQKLKDKNLTWIWASNFSLGMNLVHQMIKVLSKANKLFGHTDVHIHETHHTKKLDAPSGTALKWQEWLGLDSEITSSRLGDVVGEHSLRLETNTEKIELTHQALDRSIFAEGSLWSADKILNDKNLAKGLLKFEELALKELV